MDTYNFQKRATIEDDSNKYWNIHYCVNQAGDNSGEYVRLVDYNDLDAENARLREACLTALEISVFTD